MRRRPSVPPTVEESESFREDLAALWREPLKVKLMILAAAMLILPVAFVAGFFLFGGWANPFFRGISFLLGGKKTVAGGWCWFFFLFFFWLAGWFVKNVGIGPNFFLKAFVVVWVS